MESKVLRITVVSACSAFLCGLLAVEWGALWWVAPLLGALLGWVGYDPIGLVRGIRFASVATWRKMANREKREPLPGILVRRMIWLNVACSVTVIDVLLMLVLLGNLHISGVDLVRWDLLSSLKFLSVPGLVILCLVMLMIRDETRRITHLFSPSDVARDIATSKKILLFWNPIAFPFTCLYYLVKWLLAGVWFVADIAIATYVFTISDGRIACAVGASMGVAIGYVAGNATLCGVAGGLVGCALAFSRKFCKARGESTK